MRLAAPFSVTQLFWPVMALLGLALTAPLVVALLGTLPPTSDKPSDFMAFWGAARLVWQGTPLLAYDSAAVTQAAGLTGAVLPASFYPPPYLLVTGFLGALDFQTAYLLFVPTSMALLLVAVLFIFRARAGLVLSLLIGFGAFWQLLHYGQNTGWITVLFLLAYASLRGMGVGGGVALGLGIIKPHLGVLVPLHLFLTKRWQALLVACLAAALFAIASYFYLGAAIWPAYSEAAQVPLQRLYDFDMPNTLAPISLYAGLRRIGLAFTAAAVLHGVFALVVLAIWLYCVRCLSLTASFALLPLATLLVLPHALAYDCILLILPVLAVAIDPDLQPKQWVRWLPWALLYLCSTWFVVINAVFPLGVFPLLGLVALLSSAQEKRSA